MRQLRKILAAVAALVSATPVLACDSADPHAKFAAAVGKAWANSTNPLIGTVLVGGKVSSPAPLPAHCGASPALYELSRKLSESLESQGAALVLGETHDNREHHWFRSVLIEAMAPRKAAAVLEQVRTDKAQALSALEPIDPAGGDAAGALANFKRLVEWDKSGWNKYPYDELLLALLVQRMPIYAGDVPRPLMMAAVRDGSSSRPLQERQKLGLEKPLGGALEAAMAKELEESHCGKMPNDMVPGMVFAQRYRDAHLANATIEAADRHGAAILLTGNTHARTDRGVPWYVRERGPGRAVLSVQLVEVEEGQPEASVHLPLDPAGHPAADIVVLTPAIARPDPCAQDIEFKKK